MKQHISVRAIIRKKDTTLLMRRSGGNAAKQGLYELPGGVLGEAEQPEDGLRRHLGDKLGLTNVHLQLHDVVTTTSATQSTNSTLTIAYLVNISGERINLDASYSKYVWADNSRLQKLDITAATEGLLEKITVFTTTDQSLNNVNKKNTTDLNKAVIYADGGSRGNPGPSAAGFVIYDAGGAVMFEGGEYLGITTNNQAEYHGVRLGLEKAYEAGLSRIDFRLDSMLVVNQMKGIYEIKNRDLWPINERIKELLPMFDKVTFSHVRREFNRHADSLVNKVLNEHQNKTSDKLML